MKHLYAVILLAILTGSAGAQSTTEIFELGNIIVIEAENTTEYGEKIFNPDKGFEVPPVIVLMFLTVLGAAVYSLEVDPLKIVVPSLLLLLAWLLYYLLI